MSPAEATVRRTAATPDPVDAVIARHVAWEPTVADVCRTYSARLVRMTDEQLAVERHRLAGLFPHGAFHHLADEEFEIRRAVAHDLEAAHAELLAGTTPVTYWTAATPGGAK